MAICNKKPNARRSGPRGRRLFVGSLVAFALALAATLLILRHRASRSLGEAIDVIGKIQMAEELYRAERGVYLSTTHSFPRYFPASPDGGAEPWDRRNHPDYPKWMELATNVTGNVRCGYSVLAGRGLSELPTLSMLRNPPAWRVDQGQPWYVLVAECPGGKARCTMRIAMASFEPDLIVERDPPDCARLPTSSRNNADDR